jgi:uncharacterized protein (TIGR02449 family)
MDELIKRLETQIKALIGRHSQLKNTNQKLHQGKFLLVREKELLLTKQEKAIKQIETLVSKLKTLESSS